MATEDSEAQGLACTVYRSARLEGFYVFVLPEEGMQRVPPELQKKLAPLTHAMDLELTAERRLSRQDATVVMRALQQDGYYLQTPPGRTD